MSPQDAVRANAAGRVLIGLALMIVPSLAGRAWIGDDAARPGVTVFARALGVRDLVLGLLTLHVVDRPGVAHRTVATVAAVDAVDCAATFAVRDQLPRGAAAGAMAIAGGAAVSGAVLAVALRDQPPG